INGLNTCENKNDAIYSVSYQTLFARGADRAATGPVTIEIPDNFPSKTESRSVDPSKVKWNK
ncbi:MAG TPA: hypothetical protein VK833_03775, partial [Gillisia sp.]|nr:hypothetical protein [Gillisia sp.]